MVLPLTWLVSALLLVLVLAVALLLVYYDRRDALRLSPRTILQVHYCGRCSLLYEVREHAPQARCPHCQTPNPRLSF